MQCSSCGFGNSGDALFCSQCGTRLMLTCGACGTQNDPGSRFCKQCGTALAEAPPAAVPASPRDADLARYIPAQLLDRVRAAAAGGAMRGERRTVSMLFADVQGSTAAAERLDPEDWAEIINGAFEHLIAPIYRYEGTLARLQGDAILAFFGAPLAHEDDPVRAVRAGLEIVAGTRDYAASIQARWGVPVAVRVGINTGLVVVGEVGSDLRVEYTALGDAINVAARMEQTADPDTVRITGDTADLLHGTFTLTDIGPVDVKGKSGPVRAFVVDGVAPSASAPATNAPLVGREAEAAAMAAAVAPVVDGVGCICSVVGEAGLGKSRLLAALRADLDDRTTVATRADDETAGVALLEGASQSFESGTPYATFGHVLRRWWGLDTAGQDGWPTVVAAVERALGRPDTDMAAFLATAIRTPPPAEHADFVASLESPVLHRRTTAAITRYLEAEAARRPLVLVLDDLHWGDSLSLALAEQLMELTESAAFALVVALRPYRDDASWRLLETAVRRYGHRSTSVTLEPLSPAATTTLLAALVDETTLDDEARRRVIERADGNPLFLEELARALRVDAAAAGEEGSLQIPASLSGLLTARLDQLDEAARGVAQVASVVGDSFDLEALGALVNDDHAVRTAVASLVRSGIVVERRRLPVAEYAFRHALIREAAYATTLLRTRRSLHARLAGYLQGCESPKPEQIARHLLAADDAEGAFPYLVQAGQHATRSMALADAIRWFTTALEAVPAAADHALVVAAHDGLGVAYGLIPDLSETSSAYQRLLDYGRSAAEPSIQVTALNRLGLTMAAQAGDFLSAEGYLAQARELAEECGDEMGLAEYHMNSCFVAVLQGNLGRAIEHDDETTRIGTAQGNGNIRFAGLMRRALNLLSTLQYDEAEPALREAIEAADAVGDEDSLTALRAIGGADLAQRHGDFRGARRLLLDGAPVLDRFGSFYSGIAHARIAEMALALGDLEGALSAAAEARRIAVPSGQPFVDGHAAACMAHVYAWCGMPDRCEELHDEAVGTLGPPMGDFFASTTWRQLGQSGLVRGAPAAAAAAFAAGLATSSTTAFWERPALLLGAAQSALTLGDPVAARAGLEDATAYVAEHGLGAYEPDLALVAGRLALAEGRPDEAEVALSRGRHLAADQGRRLLERGLTLARADAARADGRATDAAVHDEHADGIATQVAGDILDPALRAGFVEATVRSPAVGP